LCRQRKPLKIKAFLKFSLSRALFSKVQLLEARSGGIFGKVEGLGLGILGGFWS